MPEAFDNVTCVFTASFAWLVTYFSDSHTFLSSCLLHASQTTLRFCKSAITDIYFFLGNSAFHQHCNFLLHLLRLVYNIVFKSGRRLPIAIISLIDYDGKTVVDGFSYSEPRYTLFYFRFRIYCPEWLPATTSFLGGNLAAGFFNVSEHPFFLVCLWDMSFRGLRSKKHAASLYF